LRTNIDGELISAINEFSSLQTLIQLRISVKKYS